MKTRKITYLLMAAVLLFALSYAIAGEKTAPDVPLSDVIFSHAFHVSEAEATCDVCHSEIEGSSRGADDNLPDMGTCGDCHDVEDDETCDMCHHNPEEPSGYVEADKVEFNHQFHLGRDMACLSCHDGVDLSEAVDETFMPGKPLCMDCHDGSTADNACNLCHGESPTLGDIHPDGWRHQHGESAVTDRQWCTACHRRETSCLQCHRGDNLQGNIHDLNYQFTHGLEASGKQADCRQCHETTSFCSDCHEEKIRMPLNHSLLSWQRDHGEAARRDVENCAACHEGGRGTCGRGGCHSDYDGVRGSDPRIHAADAALFEGRGGWHSDPGYYCYQCHTSSNQAGIGFCGYCHGGD